MSAREAREIAGTRLAKYCNAHCGALTWTHIQKIKSRWLVDFDAQRQKFTVTVQDDGNSSVTVWDK
jgi:hypothetical protein